MQEAIVNNRSAVSSVIDSEVKNALILGAIRGLRQALRSSHPLRPHNDLGMQRYSCVVEQVSAALIPLGFKRTDEFCQVRLESNEEHYVNPVRILLCKGRQDVGQSMVVNPKGMLARQLVTENAPIVPQLGLWPKEECPTLKEMVPYQNHWLFWEVTGLYQAEVSICLALPVSLNSSGTRFACEGFEELYRGSLDDFIEPDIQIPEGATVIPTIEEVD